MAITTPTDLILLALKHTGVIGSGQTASAEDITDSFNLLNMMLEEWSTRRWMVYHLQDVSIPSTGSSTYTVGPGGDFNIDRPNRIDAAYMVQTTITPNQPSYPLTVIQAYEDWARIRLKTLKSWGQYVFYDSGFPLGTLHYYPVIQTGFDLHIVVKSPLTQFSTPADQIELPDGYKNAIFYNLCCRIRPAYQFPPDQTLVALAKASLQSIRSANVQVPRLRVGVDPQGTGSIYDGWFT